MNNTEKLLREEIDFLRKRINHRVEPFTRENIDTIRSFQNRITAIVERLHDIYKENERCESEYKDKSIEKLKEEKEWWLKGIESEIKIAEIIGREPRLSHAQNLIAVIDRFIASKEKENQPMNAIDAEIAKYEKEYADKSAEELRKDIHNSLTKLYTHNLGFDYGLDRQIRIMERILKKKESQIKCDICGETLEKIEAIIENKNITGCIICPQRGTILHDCYKALTAKTKSPKQGDDKPMTTIGEKRVRVKYRPADHPSDIVDEIKQRTAALINTCYEISTLSGKTHQMERHRLIGLAMTKYEEAAMWAVKAATVEKE